MLVLFGFEISAGWLRRPPSLAIVISFSADSVSAFVLLEDPWNAMKLSTPLSKRQWEGCESHPRSNQCTCQMHIICITARVCNHQWYPPSLTYKIAHDHLMILHVFSWIYALFPQFSDEVGIDLACDYSYNEQMVISNQLFWGVTKPTAHIASLFRCSNFPMGWMVPCKKHQSSTILQA